MRRLLTVTLLLAAGLQAQAIRSNSGFATNRVPANDDGSSSLVPLGFEVNFFGKARSFAYVNNNGNITFDAALATYTPFGLTGTQREIIAAFFADVDTRSPGSKLVTYGTDTIDGRRAFGVNYLDVGYYNTHADKTNSFQLILIERSETGAGNFDIEFNYQRIAWETGDASSGVGGLGGVPASVGWSNGSGADGTSFELEGSLIPGSFLDGGRKALNRNRYSSPLPGRYIFRARNGQVLPPLTITSGCPLPTGFTGTPYSQTLSAVGATSYRWEMLADPGAALAPGLTLSANGSLSGTPTSFGTSDFTLRVTAVTDDGEQTAAKRCSITVRPPSVSILSACPLPAGKVGQPYSLTLQAAGGRGPYTWSLTEESAPLQVGLSLLPGGAIQGVPREAGTSVVLLRARGNPADNSEPAVRACSITIHAEALELTSGCSLPSATTGVPYSQPLTVSGGAPPYVWTPLSSLPAGISLTRDGMVYGAPASNGGSFHVRVRDARGNVNEQWCSLEVGRPVLEMTTGCPLPPTATGHLYAVQLEASGGAGPYSWTSLGAMPSGFALTGDGMLAGSAGASGVYGLRFLVTDSAGHSMASGCNLLIQPSEFSISNCPLPNASIGVDYLQNLRVHGGVGPYVFSALSGIPPGLAVNSKGLISGRAREQGTGIPIIQVMDSEGRLATQPCTLAVNPSPVTISAACPLPVARVGVPYDQRFTASGGVSPYRFRIDGALPPGLRLTTEGTVQGTATAIGQFEFEIEAMDATGRSVPMACSVQASLPELPVLRLGAFPATVAAASNGPTASIELSRTYSLPVQGQLVITAEADTGSFEPNINRPDPRVRFANGMQTIPFTIPAGVTRFSAPIVSTGTVASTITVRALEMNAGGVRLLTPPSPRQFRVARGIPVITDACLASSASGQELRVTGYSTTRSLQQVEFTYTTGSQQQTTSVNVAGSASDYFSLDEAVRNGGAFTLAIPMTLQGSGPVQPNSVTLSNSVGVTAARTVAACR